MVGVFCAEHWEGAKDRRGYWKCERTPSGSSFCCYSWRPSPSCGGGCKTDSRSVPRAVVNTLAEGRPGPLLVEFRPQERGDGVAPAVARGPSQHQIGEQRHAFGLADEIMDLLARGVANACSTEGSEFEGHAESVSHSFGFCFGTAGQRPGNTRRLAWRARSR